MTAPGYAPWVSLLREDSTHLQASPAPTYWSLAPFYIGQFSETSCSVASATMVINAVRACSNAGSAVRPASQQAVLDAVGSMAWRAGVERDDGRGATLHELASHLEAGLTALTSAAVTVEATALPGPTAAAAASFRDSLRACEASPGVWIVANYLMEAVIGAGDYGHFSPIGAYDAGRDRVLVLDVYRQELEPYWVPTERLFAGMATLNKDDGLPRGYVTIRLRGS